MTPFPIEEKLVIAIASSALFDLEESDRIFRKQGEDEYRKHQRNNENVPLEKGVAFSFISRFLSINEVFSETQPVEVILLSKNDPDTGMRVFRSIAHYGLTITRAAFLSGRSPYKYIPSFNASLFLTANEGDVREAINANLPAGTVLRTETQDESTERELRIAFDFDGVIVGDESETVYRSSEMEKYREYEVAHASDPIDPGPLQDFFIKLSKIQKLEYAKLNSDDSYERIIRIAVVTARNCPAHERCVNILRSLGVFPDETFFLGGIAKRRVLEVLRPHIFFDDQMVHLESVAKDIPSVHIPFGVANTEIVKTTSE